MVTIAIAAGLVRVAGDWLIGLLVDAIAICCLWQAYQIAKHQLRGAVAKIVNGPMRRIHFIVLISLLYWLSCGNHTATTPAAAPAAQITPPSQAAGYTLAFSDGFSPFDLSPDGTGNHTWYPGIWWESIPVPFHASVYASLLDLAWTPGQNPADTTISSCAPKGGVCHAFRYGYFEVRMKWDVTTGAWPAFWMIPTQGFTSAPETGELDVFEGQGDPQNAQTFFGTIHDWKTINGKALDVANNDGKNAYTLPGVDFSVLHTYGVLWVPGQVTWYLDNQPVLSSVTYPIFDQQNYFLMLGSQEGVNWISGNTTGVTASSLNLYVAWVRVWQRPVS